MMRVSRKIYDHPENRVRSYLEGDAVDLGELIELIEPVLEKVAWQEETLARNVISIRKTVRGKNKAEEYLKRMRLEMSDLELEMRIERNRMEELYRD